MKHCPKCKTTRRPGLTNCHGCDFEFGEQMAGNRKLMSSLPDYALGLAVLVTSISAVVNVTLAGVAFLGAISGSRSLTFNSAVEGFVLAFVSYVFAIVFWRVLNLPKQ